MLNNFKTEFFIAKHCTTIISLKHLTLHVDSVEIQPSPSVKNLGVVFDHKMKMSQHVTQISCTLNWQLGNLYCIRRFLDFDACNNAVRALVMSKLYYCCAIFN